MQRLNIALALAAGFLGGLASRYVVPLSVSAQAQTRTPNRVPDPLEVRGQSFVLTDSQGNGIATFGTAPSRGPGRFVGNDAIPNRTSVVLKDQFGKEIWRAPAEMSVRPLKSQ